MSTDLTPEIAAFFQDPATSSAIVLGAQQVAAPVVQGATLTDEEVMMGGGLRLVNFVLDGSGSMSGVAQQLREAFTNDFVPAVQAAREDDTSALRIGGAVFSDYDPDPIWVGANGDHFHALEDLPALTTAEYNPEMWGGLTALHHAIDKETKRAVRAAAELQMQTGVDVDIDIIILSDGANNMEPRNPAEAKRIITGCDRTRMRYVYFYFETGAGGQPDPRGYAINQLGIPSEQVEMFLAKPGETADERAKRFRRLMAVMSRVSAARGTSAVVATAAVLEDDEII